MKRLVIFASLVTIGGIGVTPAAEATPIQVQFRVAPGDDETSTRIIPATEPHPLVQAPIVALMRTSVADRMAKGAVSVGTPLSVAWRSPFPSPVSLRLGKTIISEALNSIYDPLQLQRR